MMDQRVSVDTGVDVDADVDASVVCRAEHHHHHPQQQQQQQGAIELRAMDSDNYKVAKTVSIRKEAPPCCSNSSSKEEVSAQLVPPSAASPKTTAKTTSISPTLRRMSLLNTLLFLGLALSQAKLHASATSIGGGAVNDNSPPQRTQAKSRVTVDVRSVPPTDGPKIHVASVVKDLDDVIPEHDLNDDSNVRRLPNNKWRASARVEAEAEAANGIDRNEYEYEASEEYAESEAPPPPQRPKKDSFIVATVDGTLAAIDTLTGKVLWKQPGKLSEAHSRRSQFNAAETSTGHRHHHHHHDDGLKLPRDTSNSNNNNQGGAARLLQPLISTTTTAASAKNSATSDLTAAIPSIDGSVFLTTIDSPNDARTKPTSGGTVLTKTDITSLQELVSKAPYVDSNGLFYVGSRHTIAAAIDSDTGEVLYVASADDANGFDNASNSDPEWKDRNVVWIGRVDYSVSIFNTKSSAREVQFSASEMMSVSDMATGNNHDHNREGNGKSGEHTAALRQDPLGLSRMSERAPHLLFNSHYEDAFDESNTFEEAPEPLHPFSELVATPSGNLAYRNKDTGRVEWVADEAFETPITYAIHSSSGQLIPVDIIPDVTMPSHSREYLTREIERQIQLTLDDGGNAGAGVGAETSQKCHGNNCKNTLHPPIIGALQNGQLYAMPLGSRQSSSFSPYTSFHSSGTQGQNLALEIAAVNHHHTAASIASLNEKQALAKKMPLGIGRLPHQRQEEWQLHGDNRVCGPSSSAFPSCLFKAAPQRGLVVLPGKDRYPVGGDDVMQEQQNLDASAIEAYVYHHHEYGQTLNEQEQRQRYQDQEQDSQQRPRNYSKILRILGSWLPPTIALIFVVSFELGRRKRQKDTIDELQHFTGSKSVQFNEMLNSVDESEDFSSDRSSRHVIKITDQVLGYGGHGTIVYRGTLEGRNVAVKRMLKTYLASADREISLLIESDGHPNVVRYFLKEVKGDFVYLALELCDLSLDAMIGTLSSILRDAGSGTTEEKSSKFISKSTKQLLFQIATGVKHLHSLRIVHNDLKPANILLALSKEVKAPATGASNEAIFKNFQNEYYVAKISDMGLGKMIADQSSFGASAFADGSMRGQSSNGNGSAGMGPGTVGWMAPEQMKRKISATTTVEVSHSGDGSSVDKPTVRVSRSVDIFSLGCIFYSALVPGLHPFGEWYEREANIMHNRPSIEALQYLSIEGYDLVSAMIQYNPRNRPNAKQICKHPFFWTLHQKVAFICDLSDRLETDSYLPESGQSAETSAFLSHPLAIERNAIQVVGLAWDKALYKGLTEQKYRTYDPSSVRDLLRLMRNKKNHFQDLEASVRQKIGSDIDGLMQYFESCFPRLLMHCYQVSCDILLASDPLRERYALTDFNKECSTGKVASMKSIPINKKSVTPPSVEMNAVAELEVKSSFHPLAAHAEIKREVAPDDDMDEPGVNSTHLKYVVLTPQTEQLLDSLANPTHAIAAKANPDCARTVELECDGPFTETVELIGANASDKPDLAVDFKGEVTSLESESTHLNVPVILAIGAEGTGMLETVAEAETTATENIAFGPSVGSGNINEGFVLWEGSTASKTLNCRGWIRSDEEWTGRVTSCNRKQAAILAKCAEDPKFRTRLCNHWDLSLGTSCPMRKKNKCVFAHGPIELRVKDGKRNRWGKLVDKHGNNSNSQGSGGEDTYGAARSIETVRKGEGKWNSQNSKQQNGVKKQSSGNKKKPKAAAKSP